MIISVNLGLMKMWSWIVKNKVVVVLVLVIVYFLYRDRGPELFYKNVGSPMMYEEDMMVESSYGSGVARSVGSAMIPTSEATPSLSQDRLVVTESSVSLQVEDVADSISQIESLAENSGGFMVNTSVTSPYEGGSGYITIRVPAEKRAEVLMAMKEMAVKVVSEILYGTDVTDQYEDIGEKLRVLESTKRKFEEILSQASDVNDILRVQQQIINVQSQIDSLRGRQEYLEKTAALSLITVNLSTDEFALPYAPDEAWRPQVVFKLAVRSLVRTMRGVADVLIWVVVYGAILVPLWMLVRRYFRK